MSMDIGYFWMDGIEFTNSLIGCRPISDSDVMVKIRRRAFHIATIQCYAVTSDGAEKLMKVHSQLEDVMK